MWLDRLDDSKTTGVESDAYWMGIFFGIVLAFGLTFVFGFFLIPAAILTELLPVLFVVALLLAYLFARVLSRRLSGYVARRRPAPRRDD